uniref:Rho GTPase-activating protein 26 n=1 Tax=Graphocephala atropunctata TaxID=36148 RepID=A0A1B6L4C8_9HEMI
MGVGLPPLEFTDCLTDSPYFRENLHAHEKELEKTSEQIKRLVKEVKTLLNAAKHLSRAQRTLSSSLQNFSFDCIGTSQTDDELVISKSLGEFGRLIALVEDERDRMLDRAYDQVIFPLENFRKEHIGGVKEGKKKFEKQTAKFCQSQERYLNLSTKKQDAVLQEADATLEMEQRHFCQASLEYVFLLQEVQERKKFEFVETLLGFMFGWLTFYHQGHEVAEDFKPYMKELQFRIQKTRENFNATRDKTESLMKKMLEMRQARPTVDEAAPNKAYSREGYLFLMERKKLGTTTWTKQYCMYQREKKEFIMIPYNQMTGKFNTSEKMILGSCVRRMSDTIEKRFCFDLTPEDRPGVVYTLQALSEEDRKQWMDVMDGKEPTYGLPGVVKQQKSEERTLDDVGFAFVQKCIEVLESRGLDEQGLYRVVGVKGKVNKLLEMGLDRRKVDKMILDDPCEWESKTITSALKKYLAGLREPLMTFRYHSSFINAAKLETRAQRVNMVHVLLHKLPKVNFRMLDILMRHLVNVTSHSDKNLMTVSNLSVCFGPTLLRPEQETVAAIMDIKFCNVVVEILIDNYNKMFKSAPDMMDVESRESSPPTHPSSPPTPPLSQTLRAKYSTATPPVTHAVIKASYYDGPLAVSLSSSQPSVSTVRDRDYYSPPRPAPRPSLPTYADYKLPAPAPPYYFSSVVNSDPVNSTSSSNESVSSLSSRDVTNHSHSHSHSTYPSTITPQKSKRGLPMGSSKMSLHYATSYRPQDNVPPGTPNSLSSGRSSPGFSQGVRRVRTLYACMGENDGELSFEPNQIITNVRTSLEPGWLEGTLNGKTGLVPENYVELLP